MLLCRDGIHLDLGQLIPLDRKSMINGKSKTEGHSIAEFNAAFCFYFTDTERSSAEAVADCIRYCYSVSQIQDFFDCSICPIVCLDGISFLWCCLWTSTSPHTQWNRSSNLIGHIEPAELDSKWCLFLTHRNLKSMVDVFFPKSFT